VTVPLPASEGCIQFSDGYTLESRYFDLQSGEFFGQPDSFDAWISSAQISPDQQYMLIQQQFNNKDYDHNTHLAVQAILGHGTVGKGIVIQRDLPSLSNPMASSPELERTQSLWLPDSQHILVRWEDTVTRANPTTQSIRQWMTLLDSNGQRLATYNTTISSSVRYFIDGISPDGQIVAMQAEQGNTIRLRFHSMKTLEPIMDAIQVDPSSCNRPWESDYRFCAYWSPQTTWVAYGTIYMNAQPALTLSNFSTQKRFEIPLPSAAEFAWRRLYWSPDGRYLAVLSLNRTNAYTASHLTLVDTSGNIIAYIPNMDYLHTYNDQTWLRWSSDSQTLLFRHYDTENDHPSSLKVLRIQTGQVDTLATGRPIKYQWETSGEPSLTDDDNMLVRWQGDTDADMLVVYYGIVNIRTGERQVLLTKNLLDDKRTYTNMTFYPIGEALVTSDDRIVVADRNGIKRLEIDTDMSMSMFAQSLSPNW
jgi:hypothetical protein